MNESCHLLFYSYLVGASYEAIEKMLLLLLMLLLLNDPYWNQYNLVEFVSPSFLQISFHLSVIPAEVFSGKSSPDPGVKRFHTFNSITSLKGGFPAGLLYWNCNNFSQVYLINCAEPKNEYPLF